MQTMNFVTQEGKIIWLPVPWKNLSVVGIIKSTFSAVRDADETVDVAAIQEKDRSCQSVGSALK